MNYYSVALVVFFNQISFLCSNCSSSHYIYYWQSKVVFVMILLAINGFSDFIYF